MPGDVGARQPTKRKEEGAMYRYLLHYHDGIELIEEDYFDAEDCDDAYRQALPLLEGFDEYQMSEL